MDFRFPYSKIQKNVPLAPFTSFNIGGRARYFISTASDDDIQKALQFAKEKNLPYFILGGGTNILVSDKGFDGIVIKIENSILEFRDDGAICGAGVYLERLIREAIGRGLAGLELLSGIGGTVGGAVRGNAGAFGQTIGERVVEVTAYLNGAKKIFSRDECQFQYRQSIFKEIPAVISEIVFEFLPGDKTELQKVSQETIKRRDSRYNINWQCAGCVFKNVDLQNSEIDKGRVIRALDVTEKEFSEATKHGKLPVSFIVDKLGLKGFAIGGAKIAEEHGAFILNTGRATADDVMQLISLIKLKVRNALGIQLQEEIQLVGF